MTDSIMIEIDDMTENILGTIENRIFDGNQQAMHALKSDLLQAVDSQRKEIRQITNQMTSIRNEQEDFSEDVTQELKKLHHVLQEDMLEKIQQVTKEQQSELISKLDDRLTKNEENIKKYVENLLKNTYDEMLKIVSEHVDSLKKDQEEAIEKLTELQNSTREHVISQLEETKQEVASLGEKVTEQEKTQASQNDQIVQLLTKATEKIEALEAELQWHTQPFYKKWFRKKDVK